MPAEYPSRPSPLVIIEMSSAPTAACDEPTAAAEEADAADDRGADAGEDDVPAQGGLDDAHLAGGEQSREHGQSTNI